MAETQKLTYSIEDARKALGISRALIYDLINKDKLRTFTIGRRRFVSEAALRECVQKLDSDNAA